MTQISIEVRQPDTGQASLVGGQTKQFQKRIRDLGESLNTIASDLSEYLHALGERQREWDLDEVTLGFSLDLQADAGVVIGRVSSKAGFQATMSWKRAAPPAVR
jgi:hypothetical protein